MARRRPLIVQQEKMLRSAASDYIDRMVDGRGLRQSSACSAFARYRSDKDLCLRWIHINDWVVKRRAISATAGPAAHACHRYPIHC